MILNLGQKANPCRSEDVICRANFGIQIIARTICIANEEFKDEEEFGVNHRHPVCIAGGL